MITTVDRPARAAALLLVGLLLGSFLTGQAASAAKTKQVPDLGLEQGLEPETDWPIQLTALEYAAVRLPLAAVLGAALAFRPRRAGTPPRSAAVIHTQIILAILGAVIMLVVGSSLARAFGIVGAAGLIRYRARIEDPKDAGVMLSTLGIGLASGVGLYVLAGFTMLFILMVLWIIESLEPEAVKLFSLTVKTKDVAALRPKLEALLKSKRLQFDLRSASHEEMTYEVLVPFRKRTDRLSNAILLLGTAETIDVEWDERKPKTK